MSNTSKFFFKVISKKTKNIPKNASSSKNRLRSYLKWYANEAGKEEQSKKNNKGFNAEGKKVDNQFEPTMERDDFISLSGEEKGGLYCGGFFQENVPAQPKDLTNTTGNKDHIWINKVCHVWDIGIKQNKRRKYDAVRKVISLDPKQLKALKESNIPVDSFLREVWTKALDSYKKENGWEKEELGWVLGFHHDVKHIHMHAVLYPTTKSGIPLRLSNKKISGKIKEQHLTGFTAILNKEAEIIWRDRVKLKYQNPDVYISRMQNEPDPPFVDKEYYCSKDKQLTKFDKNISEEKEREMEIALDMVNNGQFINAKEKKESYLENLHNITCLWANTGMPTLGELEEVKETKFKNLKGSVIQKEQQNEALNYLSIWEHIKKEGEAKEQLTEDVKEKPVSLNLVKWMKNKVDKINRFFRGDKTAITKKDLNTIKNSPEKEKMTKKKIGHMLRQLTGEVDINSSTYIEERINIIKEQAKIKSIKEIIKVEEGELGYQLRKLLIDPIYEDIHNKDTINKNLRYNLFIDMLSELEPKLISREELPNKDLLNIQKDIEFTSNKLIKQEYNFLIKRKPLINSIYSLEILNEMEEEINNFSLDFSQDSYKRPDLVNNLTIKTISDVKVDKTTTTEQLFKILKNSKKQEKRQNILKQFNK